MVKLEKNIKKLSVFDTKVVAFTRKKIKKDSFVSALF